MIGLILYKKKYFGAKNMNSKDNCVSNSYELIYSKISQQESKYKSELGLCCSNSNTKDSQEIFSLYKENSFRLLEKLKLEFSFALLDHSKKYFFGSRDRMGIKPFYYYDSNELFIYSTDIGFIKNKLKLSNLNNDWIISSLSGTVYDTTSSQITEIKKLAPAHYLILDKGKLRIEKYWSLKKQNLAQISEEEQLYELKKRLVSAIINRKHKQVASELSGGLDSSAIAGVLASISNHNLDCYSHTLKESLHSIIAPFGDERHYRDLVANTYNNITVNNIDSNDKGLFYELQDELKRQSVPISNTLAYFSDGIFDQAQKDGIDTLFSGFGGDEGISNFANILPYQLSKEFKLKALKEATGLSYFSKIFIAKALRSRLSFLPKKNTTNWREETYKLLYLNPSFSKTHHFNEKYWSFHSNKKVETLNEYIYQKLTENYIPNRAEAIGASARTRGIEYTYPLLDVDLLEYYYAMSDSLKFKKGIGRYAYRQIIKDFVPPEIYHRTSKTGATIPNVLARFMKDYRLIKEFLQSVRKGKAEQYIDFDKMITNMDLIKQHSKGIMIRTNQHIFFNALMIILYLEREY